MTPHTYRSRAARRAAHAAIAAAWFGAAGCASVPSGYPCAEDITGQFPQPNGTYARMYMYRQAVKAEAEDFVLYHYEWLHDDPDRLGPFGTKHVHAIAKRLATDPFPVVIEHSEDPQLDALRKAVVIFELTKLGVTDAAVRVYVGPYQAEGLYGDEAPEAYRFLISGGDLNGSGRGGGGFGGSYGAGFGGFGGMTGGFGGFGGMTGGFGGFGGGFRGFGGF
jgi:hypothetical protein